MKERMLTVLVPIKDTDCESTTYQNEADLIANVPVSVNNINKIYKLQDGTYRRVVKNANDIYEYQAVIDREFPYLGRPLEIFDFTYDATRMGTAPTISAQNVMWYAEKDEDGNDVTLEKMWNQECHVSFNGENFYLKLIPTSTKANDDARYKYDIDFVSERAVLEHVYLYDVVQPYSSDTPISESATFSFFGDVSELAKRINASLIRSGLAKIQLKSGVAESDVLTYEEWNEIGLGTYSGSKPIRRPNYDPQSASPYIYFYPYYAGVYNNYLLGEIYALDDNNELIVSGYQCRLGLDDKGEMTTSDGALLSYDNVTIYQALQDIKDKFNLQYYVFREKDSQGEFTGNTIIMIADCEHDFADWDEAEDDFVRDDEGIPTTENPFDYGVEDALLSKEKANTTEKIVTRITGTGSSENIPWYYPNPNADGWVRPVYKVNGVEDDEVDIDYPVTDDNNMDMNTAEAVQYEKFLKNRVGDVINYGGKRVTLAKYNYTTSARTTSNGTVQSGLNNTTAQIVYEFEVEANEIIELTFGNSYRTSDTTITRTFYVYNDNSGVFVPYTPSTTVPTSGTFEFPAGSYLLVYDFTFVVKPTVIEDVDYYWYPEKEVHASYLDTWPIDFFLKYLPSYFGILPLLQLLGVGVGVLLPGVFEYALYQALSLGFTVKIPSFLSTDPNLRFGNTNGFSGGNLVNIRWYKSNGTPVSESEMIFPNEKDVLYVFRGGDGAKTVGVDSITRVTYGRTERFHVTPPFLAGYNVTNGSTLADYNVNKNYLYNYVWGSSAQTSPKTKTIEDDIQPGIDDYIEKFITFDLTVYQKGWFKNNKKINLSDWGIDNETELSSTATVHDTIEFQRVKYVTPQSYLMPELYIRTDGERRFYNAINYPKQGTADAASGEVQSGTSVINPIYKSNESGASHYDFENEYIQTRPHEHIEKFEDVKPSIKGQMFFAPKTISFSNWEEPNTKYYGKNADGTFSLLVAYPALPTEKANVYISQRIDIVEEFAYDDLDNDEIWESIDDGNVSGEYKHPYFFAKLRPLGFNLFDLALQDDMVLSMTTGNCGACNFKIGVDENTQKNPVQIWQYDVYRKTVENSEDVYTKVYDKGDLRRYVDVTDLYYKVGEDTFGHPIYLDVRLRSSNTVGFLVPDAYSENQYKVADFDENDVANGWVGNLKSKSKIVFDGDVVVNGRFIDSQQDTSENYVWVALYKDIDTYGTIMPSANPDYIDNSYSRYIEPKGHKYTNRKTEETTTLDDDAADKFVLINIRMPQVYLRRAEHELSRAIVAYMNDHNYQKYNFSIKFSRIFLAQNESIDENLNENSVLYVNFNKSIFRQYVKHYTYKMSNNEALPEITVELNEELLPTRTKAELEAMANAASIVVSERRMRLALNSTESRITRRTVSRNDTVVVNGNIVNRDSAGSLVGLQNARQSSDIQLFDTRKSLGNTQDDLDITERSLDNNIAAVGNINLWAGDVEYIMEIFRDTMEARMIAQCVSAGGSSKGLWYDDGGQIETPGAECFRPAIPELDNDN